MKDLNFYSGADFSPCKKYRYLLWRKWSHDKPCVLFICLNPSTAGANQNDRTTSRLMKFAKKWGYGGFYLVNLFAYRSTKPEFMIHAASCGVDIVGPENDRIIKEATQLCEKVVFAWGVVGAWSVRDKIVEKMFQQADCIARSKEGFPSHPLYLKGNLFPITYK